MGRLRFLTAGESHGPALTVIVDGMPAGVPVVVERIDEDLARRQTGLGSGRRMQIERDRVSFASGVRWGETLGSPVAVIVENRDYPNWGDKMSPDPARRVDGIAVTRPRPGHADLTGALKYDRADVRDILERASARETTMRVVAGGLAKELLRAFGIEVRGHVREIGPVSVAEPGKFTASFWKRVEASEARMWDPDATERVAAEIDAARRAGDSLGGIWEVRVTGLPPGLGSHVQWDLKLDGRLAQAVMSLQAHKGVEIGLGFESARRRGSHVHDEIAWSKSRGYSRRSNRAGGTEGGMSTGEDLVVRGAMKPISTLYKPLRSVDLTDHKVIKASVERSDICAVPRAVPIAEAVVAFTVADAFVEKFGGDSLGEIRRNYEGYLEQIRSR